VDLPLYTLVKVIWKDAHGSATGAYSLHEIPHEAIEVASYGLLLRHDDIGVSIASEKCGDDTYRGYTFIPVGMIVSVGPVKRKRPTRTKKLKTIMPQEMP
jgi:hypothetical protein